MVEFDGDVGTRPQLQAPTLAALSRQIAERPLWQVKEPIEVDFDTFEVAREEMKEILGRQGRLLAVAPWIARPNFLLRGIAVVMNDAQD